MQEIAAQLGVIRPPAEQVAQFMTKRLKNSDEGLQPTIAKGRRSSG
ncbi:hypothetical protein ACFRU3_35580 [Streptomyces sp. NPDC056910]